MCQNVGYLTTCPGILKLITINISFVAIVLCSVAKNSNFNQDNGRGLFGRSTEIDYTDCKSTLEQFEGKESLQTYAIVILSLLLIISTGNLYFCCVYQQIPSCFKCFDVTYHACGWWISGTAGALMMGNFAKLTKCIGIQNCEKLVIGERKICYKSNRILREHIRYYEVYAGVAFSFINIPLFIFLAVIVCAARRLPAQPMGQPMVMGNNANSTMLVMQYQTPSQAQNAAGYAAVAQTPSQQRVDQVVPAQV